MAKHLRPTASTIATIQSLYNQGVLLRDISAQFGITASSILHYIPRTARRQRPNSRSRIRDLAPEASRLRAAGQTYQQISQALQISTCSAWKLVNSPAYACQPLRASHLTHPTNPNQEPDHGTSQS